MKIAADTEPDLGLVVPAYNEEENVSVLVREITETMEAAGVAFELLVVDDGSKDGTVDIVRKLAKADPRIRALVLTRNFGHQAAISIGLTTSGDAVGIMDADLQDRPADALALYLGAVPRPPTWLMPSVDPEESVFKRAAYHLFYRLLGRLARIDIPLDSGDFCAMSRAAVDRLNALPERLRFVRGLRS